MNDLYPVFLKLGGKPVLVVGGGPVALRRAERLLEAGARVTVVSPGVVDGLRALGEAGKLRWIPRRYEPSDLGGHALVLVAAGDAGLLEEIRAETRRRGIWLGAADDEALSDFHVPAVLHRGVVLVAVSTAGTSPAGAARIRDAIDRWLEERGDDIDDALRHGRAAPQRPGEPPRGKVYLVGAGPGDPGLLTLRAAEVLRGADLVLHDRLVSPAVLARVSPRAEKVYVGKEVGCPLREDTRRLMADGARAGKTVVRLKGGDPFVFGRGAEEMAALRDEGIDLEVVPGVSALTGVPGAAGIPVTCRGVARQVVVRSGHPGEPGPSGSGHPSGLEGATETTYVYFMAAGRIPAVVEELRAEGLAPWTPVAIVQKGTLPEQRVLVATLGTLAEAVAREGIATPALLVAGNVVRLRDPRGLAPILADQAAGGAEE
ncbi:MAG: uroporphyrinogen-III C-methyltransferase [Planctomycetes bacterium]|nr:uroporphyrinogen-III C-methyltransferase [Planctomycetota bacterium]